MKNQVIGMLAALGLAFHLSMTAIYLGPPNLLQLRLGDFAFKYMHAFFYQNWHLFSPNPGISSIKFAVRCADADGHWSPWKDPFAGAQRQHQLTRITGYGKVLMLFGDLAQSLKKDAASQTADCRGDDCFVESELSKKLQESPRQMAYRFANDYCRSRHPERPKDLDSIQYKVLEFIPVNYTEFKAGGKRWDKVIELPFPPARALVRRAS